MRPFNEIQLGAVDKYFKHLSKTGYMEDYKVSQMIVGMLLIDTLSLFKEFVTEEYLDDIKRVLKELDCCNCTITWDDYKSYSVAPYNHPIM